MLKLPPHVINHITDHLLLKDQRTFYLCCPQLYKLWNAQIKATDTDAQFLVGALSLLDQSLGDATLFHSCERGGTCIKAYYASTQSLAEVAAAAQPCPKAAFTYSSKAVVEAVSTEEQTASWSAQTVLSHLDQATPRQVLTRLSKGPGVTAASITLSTRENTDWDVLRETALKWFSLLCSSKGQLIFYSRQTQVPKSTFASREHLRVRHWDSQLRWTVDGCMCQTAPPDIDFDRMPKHVSKVVAQFYSRCTAETGSIPVVPQVKHMELCEYPQFSAAEGAFAFEARNIPAMHPYLIARGPLMFYDNQHGYLLDTGHLTTYAALGIY